MHSFQCTYNSSSPEVEDINSDNVETNENYEETNPTIIHCDGAYTSIKDCIDLMLAKINEVVAQVKNVTVEQALHKFFIIACADRAKHKGLGKTDNGMITYSLTIGSCFLIE